VDNKTNKPPILSPRAAKQRLAEPTAMGAGSGRSARGKLSWIICDGTKVESEDVGSTHYRLGINHGSREM